MSKGIDINFVGRTTLDFIFTSGDFMKKMFHFMRMIWYYWRKYKIDYLLSLCFGVLWLW